MTFQGELGAMPVWPGSKSPRSGTMPGSDGAAGQEKTRKEK